MKIGCRDHTRTKVRLLANQQIGARSTSIWESACRGYLLADQLYEIVGDDPENPQVDKAWQVDNLR